MDVSEATGSVTATGDPAVARQEYLAASARTISIVDIALIDYRYLQDNAPSPTVAAGFGLVIDEFTTARDSLVAGQQVVEASDPLTAEAYTEGVSRFGDATRNLSYAGTLLQQIELPDAYQEAGSVEPACAG